MAKIGFISLGCPKNLVDSERILTELRTEGYDVVPSYDDADMVIVNTCGFIDSAVQESLEAIGEALNENGKVIVTGCLGAKVDQIREVHPKVLEITGPHSYEQVLEHVHHYVPKPKHNPFQSLVPEQGVKLTPRHYAYLKISEGCNKRCTYCIIPSLRGPYRSVPMEQLLAEAKELADQGVKELILVAQETTLYGVDLYGEKTLPKLLHELAQIDGIEWIRIQYCYPEEITEELIQAIKTEEKVCHYLDIPIQHASDAVLKRMGRRTNQAELRERIAHLREEIPDIALRTTLISGFPGETQEDHEELMRFVDEMEFDRLGVFAYSAEEDTPAAGYPDQVPQEVKEDRRDEIMELQQEIAFEKPRI